MDEQAPDTIGFYFGRTNHERVSGVGHGETR
jgi:hypothetical protein